MAQGIGSQKAALCELTMIIPNRHAYDDEIDGSQTFLRQNYIVMLLFPSCCLVTRVY